MGVVELNIGEFIGLSLFLLICFSICDMCCERRTYPSLIFCSLSLATIVVIFVCIIGLAFAPETIEAQPYVVHEIVGLNDSFQINGRIGMRSGYINEQLCYTYGYRMASGGMKVQNVDSRNAEVFMRDGQKPKAEWFKRYYKFWFLKSDELYLCKIYLPTGSIIEEYAIDFK